MKPGGNVARNNGEIMMWRRNGVINWQKPACRRSEGRKPVGSDLT